VVGDGFGSDESGRKGGRLVGVLTYCQLACKDPYFATESIGVERPVICCPVDWHIK
jgi:hypothetical protein